ncbi:MAG: hypothetical protein U5J63_09965 [Fodinibius sp.]|nr:hypothetical protein [Fodinibius sp.]
MTLNADSAKGNAILRYRDLKISLLDRETNEQNFSKKVTSLLANTFKVKRDNAGPNPRKATIEFEHNSKKSVFNYWWKSLLSGLKTSIGI